MLLRKAFVNLHLLFEFAFVIRTQQKLKTMAEERKQPIRTGILDMLRNSTSVQYIIPAYQRNYTWKANIEVKKLLDDLDLVIEGKQTKHFLGIMIYLQQPSGMFRIECSVIDGQQRLTTIFLLLYALKEIMSEKEMKEDAELLEDNYLINVTQKTDRYKLTKVSHLPFYWLPRIIKHCNILIDNLLTFRK